MRFQSIYDIAAICVKKGLTKVVLCPGSRCAPLTLAFTRHPAIKTRTFSDERSAGFVALGMAQEMREPVALICTSGTAVYNLAPSVAEAYFSHTPLVVITADRPSEWIAQHDGQTIYQSEIFGRHVKKYFQLPQEYDHSDDQWAINRIINEAVNLSRQVPQGPVHINAPFREPLYPGKDEIITYGKEIRIIDEHRSTWHLTEQQKAEISGSWSLYKNILIVGGQQDHNSELVQSLNKFLQKNSLPFVSDIISNCHEIEKNIKHADLFLGQATENVKRILRPDLLITFGQSLISKNVKLFLRKHSPKRHWHIQPGGTTADTFKNLTDIFHIAPEYFFDYLNEITDAGTIETRSENHYENLWRAEDQKASEKISGFFEKRDASEPGLVYDILTRLPRGCNLHLANSMSVRYANFFGLTSLKKDIRVFSNRGTSGIDGCSSTSVGHCLASGKPTFLITGDVAFFYDRNAFWHNYAIPDLRVLLLNNHGGLIFNVIDGPASMPESPEYFVTEQKLSAEKLCEEFGFRYLKADHTKNLKTLTDDFFEFDSKVKILELESDVTIGKTVFENLKQKIKMSYES